MLALDDIIDFLLRLLRDDGARAAFEQDPHTALADAGLTGATAHDIRDARLLLADSGAARPDATGQHHAGGDDPVREISYTTQHFHAVPDAPGPHPGPTITIDDRDTFFVRNSVDSHDDITVIEDSFNDVSVDNSATDVSVDNSSVDNSVDNSSVVNDVVAIQDNDVTNVDDSVDNTVVAVQDNDTITQVVPDDPADPAADPAADPTADPTAATVDPGAPDDPGTDLTDGSDAFEPEPDPEPDHLLDADPTDPGPDPGPDVAVA